MSVVEYAISALLDMVFVPRGEVGMEESRSEAKGSRAKKPQGKARKTGSGRG